MFYLFTTVQSHVYIYQLELIILFVLNLIRNTKMDQLHGNIQLFSNYYTLFAKNELKLIFDWNHISDKLTENQIIKLKSYYHTYHRKCWAYKQAVKRFKKWKLLGNSLSIVFASGGPPQV